MKAFIPIPVKLSILMLEIVNSNKYIDSSNSVSRFLQNYSVIQEERGSIAYPHACALVVFFESSSDNGRTVTAAGKAVLVTGCDNVLGNALARRLDDLGYHVFAAFQNKSGNIDADMLKEDCSGRLHTLQLDITSETQILAASLYIVDHLPEGAQGLWAIVNCESWCALGELEWVPFAVIKRAMEVNLLGPSRLVQVMLPLVRRARGRVVLASSILTHVAAPVRGVHAASLAALEALAACLRRELKPRGVEVVVVAAGEYTTGSAWLSEEKLLEQARDMWKRLSDEQKGAYGEDYFEQALRSLEKYTKSARDDYFNILICPHYKPLDLCQDADLTAVTRALSDGVTRTFPLARYTPVSPREKVKSLFAEHLPRTIYDALYAD
ncbi:D-beta-hydroxybutyrate dehydrogenase, mitochondrial [Eumeta japonica]|uniref:D-beta-hydroxybutyrate dehydrogenase, mitochondrial n=1 Tax=Eumeta variegata TaxID=151549 RepID=A0A4C1Y5W3_EUMVA|nr:D-beta-hydroxybutyrate dehydrogenase, mitochondrial [Eumeta japonica]